MKLCDNFFQRFLTEVSDSDHLILGAVYKVFNRINARTLQAVEATNGHVKLLNGHLKYLLFYSRNAFNHNFSVLRLVREIYEQVEMFVEYLGAI